MKKRIISILLLLSVFCLLSCQGGEQPTSESKGNEQTPTERIAAVDSGGNEGEIFYTMPYDDLIAAFPNALHSINVAFLKGADGRSLLVWFDRADKACKIEVLSARDTLPSKEEFDQIEAGMTLSEVTDLIGIPHSIPQTSGLCYYNYMLDDQSIQSITWEVYENERIVIG